MEYVISYLLRIGVVASALIVTAGGIWNLAEHRSDKPEYQSFMSEPGDLRSPRETLREAEHFDSKAVIMVGLLVLIATPIFRVAFTVFAFGVEKDWVYVAMASLVLAILLSSISS